VVIDMDETIAREINQAVADADAAAVDFARWEEARQSRDRVVIKDHVLKPEQGVAMTPEQSTRWADWAVAIAERAIEEDWANVRGDVIASFVSEYVGQRMKVLTERIEAVELTNIALHAEIDTLRNKAAGSDVVDLHHRKAARDVA